MGLEALRARILCIVTLLQALQLQLHAFGVTALTRNRGAVVHPVDLNMGMMSKSLASVSLALSLAGTPVSVGPFGNMQAAWDSLMQDSQSVLCSLENQNIDDWHGSCQQLDRIVRYRAGKLLTIEQDWGSSASTGSAVWNGANMASWYLEHGMKPGELKGAKVVELGAGVGFTSLVANALGATDVTITDGSVDVLGLANRNIALNVDASRQGEIRTAQLRWATDDEKAFVGGQGSTNRPIDVVLVSDCTYKKASWADLMGTISRLTTPGVTRTVLSMEPRNVGEVEGVRAEAEKLGLTWEEKALPVDRDRQQCSLLCARLFVLSK